MTKEGRRKKGGKKDKRKEKGEERMEGVGEVPWAHVAASKGRPHATREKGQSPVDDLWSPWEGFSHFKQTACS